MSCTVCKKFKIIFWLALLATTPFMFQFLPLRRSAPHRPGTVKIFGIQLQDVAVNTNLVRSESAFGTSVVGQSPSMLGREIGLPHTQRSAGGALDVEGSIDVLQEVPM